MMQDRHLALLTGLALIVLMSESTPAFGEIPSKFKPVPPCPALVAAADVHHIPLEQMGAPLGDSGTNALHPGDSATVLVTFTQKKKRTQWLLYLEAAAADPISSTQRSSVFVVTSSFGPPMKFRSKTAPIKMRMLGPVAVAETDKAQRTEVKEAEFAINEDFLGLGLDQSAALLHRWSQKTNFDGAITSKALLSMNPTLAEQRAICATFPAVMSYFNIVQHTEGLEDLLRKLIELPSFWSLITHRGVKAELSFGNGLNPSPAGPDDWNLPSPAYYFPWLLRLNDKPALKITMVVTKPQSPLLICGGVTALLAEKGGDEETYMLMRIISARRGKEIEN